MRVGRRTSNFERRTSNAEHRTLNLEHWEDGDAVERVLTGLGGGGEPRRVGVSLRSRGCG